MSLKFSNFGKAVIASAPSGTTGLSFSVEAGKGLLFPVLGAGDYFYGIFKDASGNHEIVKVVARSTDSMTIATGGRGLDGTAARSWAAGDYFVAGIVNAALEESLANPILSALGGVPSSADKLPYFNGVASAALTDFTPFARTLLAEEDALSMRNLLGAAGQAFPAGTKMLFYQASAPTGWTHLTGSYDHALRVVSGGGVGGSIGGGIGFSAAFKSQSVAGSVGLTTLTTAQIPAHGHGIPVHSNDTPGSALVADGAFPQSNTAFTQNTGGGGSHNHSFTGTAINLQVAYLNIIVATKN